MNIINIIANENNLRFFLAFLNHLIWSTLTVASRYLQVYAKPKVFDGQAVLATSKATSAILIYASSQLNICSEVPRRDHSDTSKYNQVAADESSERDDECCEAGPQSLRRDQDASKKNCEDPFAEEGTSLKRKILFSLLLGTAATCRAALNIESAKFTLSYYVTTINSLSPLVVSIGDALLLKTDLPKAIWPCAISSFLGCAIIGFSQSPFFAGNDTSEYQFTSSDAIGCALQLASMCFSSAARLLMKSTQDILTRNEALQVNNICNTIFPVIYTLIANPRGWVAFRYMTLPSFLAWLTVSVLVYTIGSTGQMSLVRSMGPGMYSSLSAIRVLASAIISAIWLNEPVDNWLEWLGLFLTMATMTIYTLASVDLKTPASPEGAQYTQVGQEEKCDNSDDQRVVKGSRTFENGSDDATAGFEMTAHNEDPLKPNAVKHYAATQGR